MCSPYSTIFKDWTYRTVHTMWTAGSVRSTVRSPNCSVFKRLHVAAPCRGSMSRLQIEYLRCCHTLLSPHSWQFLLGKVCYFKFYSVTIVWWFNTGDWTKWTTWSIFIFTFFTPVIWPLMTHFPWLTWPVCHISCRLTYSIRIQTDKPVNWVIDSFFGRGWSIRPLPVCFPSLWSHPLFCRSSLFCHVTPPFHSSFHFPTFILLTS